MRSTTRRFITRSLRSVHPVHPRLMAAVKRTMSSSETPEKKSNEKRYTAEDLLRASETGFANGGGRGSLTKQLQEAYAKGKKESELAMNGAISGAYKEGLESGKKIGASNVTLEFDKKLQQVKMKAFEEGLAKGAENNANSSRDYSRSDRNNSSQSSSNTNTSSGSGNNNHSNRNFYLRNAFFLSTLATCSAMLGFAIIDNKKRANAEEQLQRKQQELQAEEEKIKFKRRVIDYFIGLMRDKELLENDSSLLRGIIAIAKEKNYWNELILAANEKGILPVLFKIVSTDLLKDCVRYSSVSFNIYKDTEFYKLFICAENEKVLDEVIIGIINAINLHQESLNYHGKFLAEFLDRELADSQVKKISIVMFDNDLYTKYFANIPINYKMLLPEVLTERFEKDTPSSESALPEVIKILNNKFTKEQMFEFIASDINSAKSFLWLHDKAKVPEIIAKAVNYYYYCNKKRFSTDYLSNLLKAAYECNGLVELREINVQFNLTLNNTKSDKLRKFYLQGASQAGILREVIIAGNDSKSGFLNSDWIDAVKTAGLLEAVVAYSSDAAALSRPRLD